MLMFLSRSANLLRCASITPCNSSFTFASLKTLAASFNDISGEDVVTKDEYFAAIHHISNVVRRDIYLERTLNRFRINVDSELVYRVLRACARSGPESYRFFTWARTNHPTYNPTAMEYEELLRNLARCQCWQTMWKLADQMRRRHINLNPGVVSFIIEEYGKARLLDQAVDLFNKCRNFDCPHTTTVYNSLLFALCQVKNFYGAYALIRRMVRKGGVPDKKTYAILVNGWCSAGKMVEAKIFLEEMSRKGFNPPVRGRDLLVEGLVNAGCIESAKEMVRNMTKEGHIPQVDTFNSLLQAVFNAGEADFGINLLRDVCILGFALNIHTYRIVISAASKAGKINEAFRLLHNAIEDGHKPFPSLYAPIVKALCKIAQFDEAFSLFADMKIKGHPPNRPVYTMLIKMCTRGGRFVDAAGYLVEMVNLQILPLSRCFDMVTDGLKHHGKHDLAMKIEELEVSIRGV